MEKWIKDRLSICLDFEVPDDMIKFIMTIKTSEELDDYFESLLNPEFDEHRLFMSDCKQRLFSKAIPNKKAANLHQQPKIQTSNKKQEKTTPAASQSNENTGGKKKNKYVNFFSKDGLVPDAILLKGRRPCDCQAAEHKLINNCLGCGRIVCEQEGSGPCLFCGDLVCSMEEMQIIKSSTKKGDNLKKSLQEKGGGEGLRKAIEQRDRLLEYDRESAKRTEVIDDEEDYFHVNSAWLSGEDREKCERLHQELHEKRHANRSSRQIKMDLFGREIVEEPVPEEYERKVRQEITDSIAKSEKYERRVHEMTFGDNDISNPSNDLFKPQYIRVGPQTHSTHGMEEIGTVYSRVQDKEILEMQDMRHCLSMHQPYASLLVAGIKKHEGRVWYTNHRGRMWIASTGKEPSPDDITEVENFYKQHYKDEKLKFPSQYQTGVLLGNVIIDDVLTQEQYRKKYPNGESESPYVFICTNPQVLPVVFPIKGSHKIYQIEPKIHRAASMALLKGGDTSES